MMIAVVYIWATNPPMGFLRQFNIPVRSDTAYEIEISRVVFFSVIQMMYLYGKYMATNLKSIERYSQ